MINYIKRNYPYFLLFIFVFIIYWIVAFPNNYGDPLANYGFSYALIKGEIPYVDFNTISTPLYAFVMAPGLLIWNNFIMFLLEQCLLVVFVFYLLNKLYGRKSYIVLFAFCICNCLAFNATYNFFSLFLMMVLIYYESKKSDEDYLIGIIIGLIIITKHTVGGLLILPSIYYYRKDLLKLIKRFIGLIIPIIILSIYLIITNSFTSFIDLCFLGLFDFTNKNGHFFNAWVIISGITFILSLIMLLKNKKIVSFYLFLGFSFVIPLFDICHYSYYLVCFTIQLLDFIPDKYSKVGYLGISLSVVYCTLLGISYYYQLNPVLNNNLYHLEYIFNQKEIYRNSLKFYDFFDSYPNALILSSSKMKYDFYKDRKIDYFSVPLYGNFGYDGNSKMKKRIDNMHDTYVIVDMADYNDKSANSQFDKELVDYINSKYEKVKSKYIFDVYYIK